LIPLILHSAIRAFFGAEIVFVSLVTDKEKYDVFVKDLPFINTCDYKGWGSPDVTN